MSEHSATVEHAIQGFRRENGRCAMVSMAHALRITPKKLPPVAEYDAWLAEHVSSDPRARTKWTGAKLRRMIVMKQSGQTVSEIGAAVGFHAQEVSKRIHLLPASLGGTGA